MKKHVFSLILAVVMILSISVPALAAEHSFSDVPPNADYAQAVAWCYENGLMQGVSNTRFDPNGTLTRSMVVTVLYRAEGEPAVNGAPAFTDTQAGTWYSNAVVWANANGIVQGYGNGLFGTNDPITKEQLDIIIRRYNGENPTWVGDPALNVPATRAEAATAFYTNLNKSEVETPAQNGKVLVAYFSATGSTERVAEYIAEATDGDLFELEPANPYTSADLNYSNSSSRVVYEHEHPDAQNIELTKTAPDNWSEYDVVFIGYPIWWHAAAWPVNHFVTDNDFTGKTVIPFCTSASSPLEGSDEKLAAMANTGEWLPGQRFSSGAGQSTVENWVDGLDLPDTASSTVLMFKAGNVEITATLNDSALAAEIAEMMPATLSMTRLYEREYYGSRLPTTPASNYETKVECVPGELVYWPGGNSLVLMFGRSAEHPTIESGIVTIGTIDNDLSVFNGLTTNLNMTISVKD